MKILIVLIIVGFFALISHLALDKGKAGESGRSTERKQRPRYVQRYAYFNPNPTEKIDEDSGEPKSWGKGDCVIRAFCGVLGLPWETVYAEICSVGAVCHDLPNSDEVIERYAKEKGLIKRTLHPQTTISEFAESHNGTYFVLLRRHAVCIKNNKVYDTGDCGRSRMKTYYELGGSIPEAEKQTKPSQRKTKKREPSAIEQELTEELAKESQAEYEPVFIYFNPNPDAGLEEETCERMDYKKIDNVVRAFCGVLGQSWNDVYTGLCKVGMDKHDMPDSRKVIAQYARDNGLVRKTLPSPMALSQFAKTHGGVYLVRLNWGLSPELTCVMDNKIHDVRDFGPSTIKSYYELVNKKNRNCR